MGRLDGIVTDTCVRYNFFGRRRYGEQAGSAVNGSNAWFALWTRSRHEYVVRDQLAMKGIETFLPTVSRWSRWRDRKRRIDWPLFPGYCFARFAPDGRLRVLNCCGVVNIVSFNGEPASISNQEIGAIRQLLGSGLEYESHPFLREGMIVEVVHGPLAGIVGRFVRKGPNTRLILSVDLISAAVSVDVDAADVSPRTGANDRTQLDRAFVARATQAQKRLREATADRIVSTL